MVEQDARLSVKDIASCTGISDGSVQTILKKRLDLRKVCARFMYKIKRTVNKVIMLHNLASLCMYMFIYTFVYECILVYSYITDRSGYCCLWQIFFFYRSLKIRLCCKNIIIPVYLT